MLHVDDGLLTGGGPHYEESLRKLKRCAPLKICENNQDIRFTGRSVKQDKKTKEIVLTQKGWAVPIEKRRKANVDSPMTPLAVKQVRSLIGKLAWPARETMPALAFDVSEMQQKMSEATVK